jgi:putative ABC transport system permease protein
MKQINLPRFIIKTILHYWKKALLVSASCAVSVMIISGALFTGDSVRESLVAITGERLGKIEYAVVSPGRTFRQDLADEIQNSLDGAVEPLLITTGTVTDIESDVSFNNIQIVGIREEFWSFAKKPGFIPGMTEDGIVLGQVLADRLGSTRDGEIRVRIPVISSLVGETPVSSRESDVRSSLFTVAEIAPAETLGTFSLTIHQEQTATCFIRLETLAELVGQQGRANTLIAMVDGDGPQAETERLTTLLEKDWNAIDSGLTLDQAPGENMLHLSSDQVFIRDSLVALLRKSRWPSYEVRTWFVNQLRSGSRETAYSFVTTWEPPEQGNPPGKDQVYISDWLARKNGMKTGDTLDISWYSVDNSNRLIEENHSFSISSIFSSDKMAGDPLLTPSIEGLLEADHCRNWDPGLPLDLARITDLDEQYWERYRGTPKAIINGMQAAELWKTPFGSVTALRFSVPGEQEDNFLAELDGLIGPEDFGIEVRAVLEEGLSAARQSQDFGQLFLGLSMFIIAAGLILTAALFILYVSSRGSMQGIMAGLGLPGRVVSAVILGEGVIISLTGTVIGTGLGLLYTQAMVLALSTFWSAAVARTSLEVVVTPLSIVISLLSGTALSMIAITIAYTRQGKKTVSELIKKRVSVKKGKERKTIILQSMLFLISGAGSGILIAIAVIVPGISQAAIFFLSGSLLLTSLLTGLPLMWRVITAVKRNRVSTLTLAMGRITYRPGRSMVIVLLFAIPLFITVTVGANRNLPGSGSQDNKSGTGGYNLHISTDIADPDPFDLSLFKNLTNNPSPVEIAYLRLRDGEDASCLNLNIATRPAILGVDTGDFIDRDSFTVTSVLPGNEATWALLDQVPGDGIIPAFADMSVITWGLGMKLGDIIEYRGSDGSTIKCRLVGGLANSIFQGKIILSEQNFVSAFPESGGYRVYLVDTGDGGNDAATRISSLFRRVLGRRGPIIEDTGTMLNRFARVENTYLAIFMVLGGLGLILGTLGLAVFITTDVHNDRRRLAMLLALGISKNKILNMLASHYLILAVGGITCGTTGSLLALVPGFLSGQGSIDLVTPSILLTAIVVNAIAWIMAAIARNTMILPAGELRDE